MAQLEVEKTQEEKKRSNYFYKLYNFLSFGFFVKSLSSLILEFFISAIVNIQKSGYKGNFYITLNLIMAIILAIAYLFLLILVIYKTLKMQKMNRDKLGKTHVESKFSQWLFLEDELDRKKREKIVIHLFTIQFIKDFLFGIFLSLFMKTLKFRFP